MNNNELKLPIGSVWHAFHSLGEDIVLVLDVETGDLLEFLWMSGYDRERDQPYHIQLRPFLNRADYSLGLPYSEVLCWRYVRLT